MTRNSIVGAMLALVFALSSTVATGRQDPSTPNVPTVTPIDGPGATGTAALDINAAGYIVGRYAIGTTAHGFLRTPDGVITTIDYPGASLTVAAAINDHGDIAGQYGLSTEPGKRHGFLLKDGVFTTFDPPGSVFTNALGINERGDIVGRYCTHLPCSVAGGGSFQAFLLQDGQFTDIAVPDALETDAFRINGRGQIVGGFLTNVEQIFVLTNGKFASIDTPDGQAVSLDTGGMNERGDIVGVYCDSAFPCLISGIGTHGFLISGGNFTTVDVPDARATATLSINARGEIVGQYTDVNGKNHGFLLSQWIYQASGH